MKAPILYVTDMDRRRLGLLIAHRTTCTGSDERRIDQLEARLESAQSVAPELAPENLVTMNSAVVLVNPLTGKTRRVTLAYPDDLDLFDDGASIFEPLGMALIGRQVGELVQCPDSPVLLRLAEISYQPEKAGALHL